MTMQPATPMVAVRGEVPAPMVAYAREKLDAVVAQSPVAVLACELHLDHHADPARPAQYHIEMAADLNGDVVRARQSAASLTEAVDGAATRLRTRIARHHDRARSQHFRHRDEASWHHDDEHATRTPFFPRAADERKLMPRTSFARSPESIEDAIEDLEELDDEFLLFVHDATGAEAVVYRVDGGYGLRQRVATPDAIEAVGIPLVLGPEPATTTVEEALHVLDESGAPFEFFVDTPTGAAMVAYHRYDGHYGLAHAQ